MRLLGVKYLTYSSNKGWWYRKKYLLYLQVLPINDEKLSNNPQNQDIEPHQSIAYPENLSDEDDGLDGLNLDKSQIAMLRRKWNYSCDKKAAKTCRKACISASKSTCQQYDCRKKLRKRFRKECKRHCRSRFIEDE